MNEDFRKRVFTPVLLPITVVGVILVFAFSLSRVLLAVPEMAATMVALFVATYVLIVAGVVSARPHLRSRTLGVGLALGLIAVIGAGAVAGAAGMRELHHAEQEADAAPAEGEPAETEIPADALVWTAVDIDYADAPSTGPAGEVTVALVNEGASDHDVVIEELGDELLVLAPGGESDVATVELAAGEYTYYCSIPGHRDAGMEGTITIEG